MFSYKPTFSMLLFYCLLFVSLTCAQQLFYGPAEYLDNNGFGTGVYAGYINPSGYPIRYYQYPISASTPLSQLVPLTADSSGYWNRNYGGYYPMRDRRYSSYLQSYQTIPSDVADVPENYDKAAVIQIPYDNTKSSQHNYVGILNSVKNGDLVRGYQRSYSEWNPQPVQAVFKNGYLLEKTAAQTADSDEKHLNDDDPSSNLNPIPSKTSKNFELEYSRQELTEMSTTEPSKSASKEESKDQESFSISPEILKEFEGLNNLKHRLMAKDLLQQRLTERYASIRARRLLSELN
uniref:Uncharacterized protein n=1 Tax=Syphacia muris TaxID=451379 RepID=A0A0N5AZC1_9BILA